jgi:ATP/ADP translocase/HEAT repeat protein
MVALSMSAVLGFLRDVLRIRPDEARRTALSALYLFCAISAFIVARIARTTLFTMIPNYREQLPLTYVGIAITVSTVMYLYARVERRLRRDHTNAITLAALIVVTLAFRVLLGMGHQWEESALHKVYWGFFIWVEVLVTFLIVQFWTLANEIFDSRQAKRLFAIIGGGGVLANVVTGFATGGTAEVLGTDNLLYVICALLTIALAMTIILGRVAREQLTAARVRAPAKKASGGAQGVFATRHVQLIAAVVVLTYIVSTMVDYQFNVILADSIPGKDERTAYYGHFFGVTGILGGIIQFSLTSRILERFGVSFALILLPISMLIGSVTLGVAPATALLWSVAFTKGSENVLRYTINDSTLQLLYLPVPGHIRGRAKAFIDGILKPLSIGGTGVILALFVGKLDKLLGINTGMSLSTEEISWISAGMLLAWLGAQFMLRREYLKSLLQTLQRRRLNFADAGFQIKDEGTIKTLEKAFASGQLGEVMHALELMPHVARKPREALASKVIDMLNHEAPEVRVAVLSYLGAHPTGSEANAIEPLLDDASREVRAAAVLAYCAAKHEGAIGRVQEMLEDYDRKVQAAVVAGLVTHGGLDGVLSCAHQLKRWLESKDPVDRELAAWVLGEVGVQNFYQPLVPLLGDENEKVRIAAIAAAGKLKSPQLIAPLIEQLAMPRLQAAASAALAAYGSSIEDTVAVLLTEKSRPSAVRTQACRILARLGDSHSAEILSQHMLDDDVHVRAAVVQALTTITHRLPGLRLEPKLIQAAIRVEAERWFYLLAQQLDLELQDDSVLLRDALSHRQQLARAQILALLGLEYAHETIDLVTRNLASKEAAARANAVEVLDNLLSKDEKAAIIPIFDDNAPDKTLQAGAVVFKIDRDSREGRLGSLLRGSDRWLAAAAALEVKARDMRALEPAVRQLLESDDAVCRETAILVLSHFNKPASLRQRLEPLTEDPAWSVRRYAQFVIAQ